MSDGPLLTVGRVMRPHGVRGEVVVELRTDDPEQRYAVGAALVAERSAPAEPGAVPLPSVLTVEARRPHQGRLIVAFKDVSGRERAEALRGVLLRVDQAALPAPSDPDEFHDHQLVGLAAVTPTGEPVGVVVRVDHAPASDMLVLGRPGGRTALVPFVKAIVPEVDLAGGRVVVDPPPGLLDL
jgi:16S rRNA processing protein RimM